MKPQRIVVVALAALAIGFLGWRWVMPRFEATDYLTGYIEGDPLTFATPVAGRVKSVAVTRGALVEGGAALFSVDPAQILAQRAQAQAELAAAKADAEDARQGERPVELAAYDAAVEAARARAREAEATLARTEPLVRKGVYAPARLDDARAALDTAAADVQSAVSRREAAALGRRDAQIAAADARVAQAEAALVEIEARLGELSPAAPGPGRIEEVFYHEGEWAPANQAIVSMIPDERVHVRFFVPEAEVSAYRAGETVRFTCDGCGERRAVIDFVATRPEYTPPVIYSRDSRSRLVFMVEARPEEPGALPPGLPVDVAPLAAGAGR